MEGLFPRFDQQRFTEAVAHTDPALALGAELVLRTHEWRKKFALRALSSEAIEERKVIDQLNKEFEKLTDPPSFSEINDLIDRYSVEFVKKR